MAKLKTLAQLEQERQDAARYALGNVTLDTDRLLLIYARQSSSKQYVSNIYSAMEQRDGLLERAGELGWTRDEQRILYIENQLARKTQVSGSLRIDQRPGLQAIAEVIETGKASAVLVVSVDRITRDEDLITPTAFANLCKKHHVLIVTDDYIFDFNNPNRDDMGRFMNEAIAAKEYVRKQIKGKMLKNRTRKANMGRVANGVAPIGLMLDESRNNLVPSPHAERVNWLYGRFRAHDANLAGLLHEILGMARHGVPLFPDSDGIDPKTIYLKRMVGGWTVKSRTGLRGILTNPMYQGHLVFNGRIVKRNAHPAIVDADNWQFAFDNLADVDLDGNPIEHAKRTVRYSQQMSTNTALLAGTRHTGKLVIDGVNGQHVYVQISSAKSYGVYLLLNRHELTANGFETSIDTRELDGILDRARILYPGAYVTTANRC
jgi:DNA invertase Pin-like site-specific DNA recombinase